MWGTLLMQFLRGLVSKSWPIECHCHNNDNAIAIVEKLKRIDSVCTRWRKLLGTTTSCGFVHAYPTLLWVRMTLWLINTMILWEDSCGPVRQCHCSRVYRPKSKTNLKPNLWLCCARDLKCMLLHSQTIVDTPAPCHIDKLYRPLPGSRHFPAKKGSYLFCVVVWD